MKPAAAERGMLVLLAAGAIVIPIAYSGGLDVFRLPKELLFRAEAIALLAAIAFWATAPNRTWKLALRPELKLAAAVVVWSALTTALSTNRMLSVNSLITIAAAAVIFAATLLAAQTRSAFAVDVLMIGACANAVAVILQELKIWTPFTYAPDTTAHYGSVGLLGNANDVGMFLAPAALAAFAVALLASGARRWIYAAIFVLLVAGLVASATRTAIGALVAGLLVLAVRHSRRAAVVVAVLVVALVLLSLSPRTSLGLRAREFADAASKRDYERLFSERLLPFLAALDMTRDHPLAGVGPGCFHYQFMSYRIALAGRYPSRLTRGWPGNWGAAHNDHLQVAAETGLPGYALFLAGMALLARRRQPRDPAETPRPLTATFAQAMRWPLATLTFVLCLAQFPLELAAPRLMLLTLGALCFTWDDDHAA